MTLGSVLGGRPPRTWASSAGPSLLAQPAHATRSVSRKILTRSSVIICILYCTLLSFPDRGLTGQAGAFFRAIPAGDRYLLKLHGNLDNAAERVLNKAEYDTAYGNDGNIHFDFPLPKLLKRLFTSYSFLFLGCSLSADRTIQTFMRVAQLEGQDNLPHHYALLACPTDTAKKATIDQRLADAHITPLWYPEGEHEYVEQILGLLSD